MAPQRLDVVLGPNDELIALAGLAVELVEAVQVGLAAGADGYAVARRLADVAPPGAAHSAEELFVGRGHVHHERAMSLELVGGRHVPRAADGGCGTGRGRLRLRLDRQEDTVLLLGVLG